MDLQVLTLFFLWCTIFNGGILIFWTGFFLFAPDLVYRTQKVWFPIPRETFNVVIYALIGFFKVVFIVFSLVPYLALSMLG